MLPQFVSSAPASKLISWPAGNRNWTDCKQPLVSSITLRHGPPRKHIRCPAMNILCCWPGMFTDTLPSNGRPIVVMHLSGKVFTKSLSSNGLPAFRRRVTVWSIGHRLHMPTLVANGFSYFLFWHLGCICVIILPLYFHFMHWSQTTEWTDMLCLYLFFLSPPHRVFPLCGWGGQYW
jgi:hypothetical protein